MLEKEIVSCFLCDDIKGIYYIDEKNKSNDIGQSLKKKISELKAKMNYAKKQLHAFNPSITQPVLSNNEELNSFLSQIVANARKFLNNTVMINETSNKSLSKSNKDDDYFIRKKFFDWIEDEYNITTNITIEDYALIAMNHFENFFIYLSFYKKIIC